MNDYDKIKDYCWVEDIHKGYHSLKAWNIDTGGDIIMAQLLFGKYYDHADRNPLNNRKYNFRNIIFIKQHINKSRQKIFFYFFSTIRVVDYNTFFRRCPAFYQKKHIKPENYFINSKAPFFINS